MEPEITGRSDSNGLQSAIRIREKRAYISIREFIKASLTKPPEDL